MLTTVSILAVASVAAALVTSARVFGLRNIVKHSTKADVLFTAGVGFALAGTLTGLATAIVSGLFMALVLSVLKGLYRLLDRLKSGFRAVAVDYPEEYNASGWVYNQGVYVR